MHPHKWALMAMLSKESNRQFASYKNFLQGHVERFMEETLIDDIAPPHLSLLYFSDLERYPRDLIERYLPRIQALIKPHLPLTLTAKGLHYWHDNGWDRAIIIWNITDFGMIPALRKQLLNLLSNDFPHVQEMEPLNLHIGVAIAKDNKRTRTLVEQTTTDQEITLMLDKVSIFLPEGIQPLLP